MEIKRDSYLQQLISYRFDGLVKVITGIRRCGKSYLLMNLYKDYLLRSGVKEDQIIVIQLDLAKDIRYRNPLELSAYVRSMVEGKNEEFYLFVDEIQMSDKVSEKEGPCSFNFRSFRSLFSLNADLHTEKMSASPSQTILINKKARISPGKEKSRLLGSS